MFGLRKKAWHNPAPGLVWMQGEEILSDAHTLIAGATGCGKSTAIHALIWTALKRTPEQTRFLFIDMKRGVEMNRYRNLPHTIGFEETDKEAMTALNTTIAIMQKRIDDMKAAGQTLYNGADLYVVIDELAFLLFSGGQEALRKLTLISQQGRAARVHLILATQNPSRAGIPASIHQNMTCRLGLRCLNAIESRQIIGVAGCETLPRYGEGLLLKGIEMRHLCIPKISDEDINARISYWSDPKNYTFYK